MKALTIKGIPEELYRRLKRAAHQHRRSINSEVLTCLERSLGPRRVDPHELLARADALRDRLRLEPLSEEELRTARAAGRP